MERPITHSLVKALQRVPGFDMLSGQDLLRIVGASENLFWPAGAVVFGKGDPGEALYVVLSGQVRIFDDTDEGEVDVTYVEPGDYFGEMSLLLDAVHTKTGQAAEDTELLVLVKESFQALLKLRPDLANHFHDTLEERRTETRDRDAARGTEEESHPVA